MIQTIRKAWGIPELRKKIIFTLLMLLIFRIGNAITVPYINVDALKAQLDSMGATILGLYNVMSGGAFATATVFALSIQPYINSSIIIQLLTVAIPYLERLAREGGEEGRKKIQSITRYTTVGIAVLQALGYYMMMKNYNLLAPGATGIWPALVIIVSLLAHPHHRVRCRQRYLHDPVRRYRLPRAHHGFQHVRRYPDLVRHQGWRPD